MLSSIIYLHVLQPKLQDQVKAWVRNHFFSAFDDFIGCYDFDKVVFLDWFGCKSTTILFLELWPRQLKHLNPSKDGFEFYKVSPYLLKQFWNIIHPTMFVIRYSAQFLFVKPKLLLKVFVVNLIQFSQ